MAELGLFVGYGAVRTGKEAEAREAAEEAVAHCNALQTAGEVESLEQVMVRARGGDLAGRQDRTTSLAGRARCRGG